MEYKVKVHWGDTDAAGIVFYPNFHKWMDEATHEFFSSIGHPTDTLFKENIALPFLETHCDFKQPVVYNVELIIQSEVVLTKRESVQIISSILL